MKTSSILILTVAAIGCGGYEGDDTEVAQSAITQNDRCAAIRAFKAGKPWLGAVTALCENRDHGNGASEIYTVGGVWWSDYLGVAHEVHGAIGNTYLSGGAQFSPLGYPTADESDPRFGGGKYSPFQGGNILWKTGASTAYATYGFIGILYGQFSAEWGMLGWPAGQEVSVGSRRRQDYDYGKINWTSSKGAWPTMISAPGNSSNRLDSTLRPRVTSVTIQASTNGNGANISAIAAGFSPGRTAILRLTRPDTGITWTSSVTVAADGRAIFPARFADNIYIWRAFGVVTAWVYQDDQNQAVMGKTTSTSIGNAFPTSQL